MVSKVLQNALQTLGIQAINDIDCCKLVGVGTDEASVNISLKRPSRERASMDILDVVLSHKRYTKTHHFRFN